MEAYATRLDIEKQLGERRAFHCEQAPLVGDAFAQINARLEALKKTWK
jgi:hypothetical protein